MSVPTFEELVAAGYYDGDDLAAPLDCDISDGSDRRSPAPPLSSHKSLTAHHSGDDTAPPELLDTALYGPVGDFVRLVDEHTEADPAAVLLCTLVVLGCIIGHSPYVQVGASRHCAALFVLVVGATSRARKGTATSEALRLAGLVDPEWAEHCITPGIASGEAIIALVADPTEDDPPRRVDRRALLLEEEFSRLLAVGRREGSTVSPIVRSAWDGRPLKVATKRATLSAPEHHIAIVGNITAEELNVTGRTLDAANGLLNRFLIGYAQRSKLLPTGGHLRDHDLEPIVARLQHAVTEARRRGEVRRTAAAEHRWADIYEHLADDDAPGLVGAVTARDAPQVIRLSLLFALLDNAPEVDLEHLEAAYAVWLYCRASAGYVFGDAIGDPIADRIDAELRRNPEGLDRTALRDLFARHVRAAQIDAALAVLDEHCRIDQRREDTGGRPRTIYSSTHHRRHP